MAVIASHWYKRTTNPSILSFSLTCLASAARSRRRLLPYLYRLLHSGPSMTATYTAASSATPRRCPHPTNPPISFLDKGISMRRLPQTLVFLSPAPRRPSPPPPNPRLRSRVHRGARSTPPLWLVPLPSPRVRWPPPPGSPLLCIVCLALFHAVPRPIWSGGAFRSGLVDLAAVALDLCHIGGEINFFTVYWFQAYF
jgi:hypothetical protein